MRTVLMDAASNWQGPSRASGRLASGRRQFDHRDNGLIATWRRQVKDRTLDSPPPLEKLRGDRPCHRECQTVSLKHAHQAG